MLARLKSHLHGSECAIISKAKFTFYGNGIQWQHTFSFHCLLEKKTAEIQGKNYWHHEKCVVNSIVSSDIIHRVLCNSRTIKSHKIGRKKRIGMQKGNHIEQRSINYSDSYVVCTQLHTLYFRYFHISFSFRLKHLHLYLFPRFFCFLFFCMSSVLRFELGQSGKNKAHSEKKW